MFFKYSLLDDSVSIILSPVVVERFTLDALLEVKLAKEKPLGSLAKTQKHALRANWV